MNFGKGLFLFSIFLAAETQVLYAGEQGDVHPSLTQEFTLDLGVFFPDREVKFKVDGPVVGPGDTIDFQSEFGLDRSDEMFSLNFAWRFGEKWELGAQYFESSGARGAVLEEDVEWDDVIFGQGSSVVAGQDFTLVRMFFGRSFESSERHEFGVGAGLHWLELGAFIEGTVILGDDSTAFRRESVSAAAPLPNIGLWYMYSISPKWAFKSRFDWLSASIGDYSGRLINASLGVNYQVLEHAGVGLSYNLFDLDVGIQKSDWRGSAETRYEGLYAYVSFYW